MACCSGGGYATNRFQITVDSNFLCPICAEVLKDPVQCRNQHYFCKKECEIMPYMCARSERGNIGSAS